MAPGPLLAAALAGVDRSAVTAEELPELVKARARLLAYEQAEFLLDLVEAAHGVCAEPGSVERYDDAELVDSAVVELGWVLRWSQTWTGSQVDFAQSLRDRLPMVLQALRAGRIDRERAFAFVDALRFLDEPMARAIAAKLLAKAENLTVVELRERLRYHIDRADPAAQRRRYRKGVAGRGVWLRGNDDGTADLAGVRLPPHRAAAAFDRIDRLARAARHDGDVRNLAQLRADAFTDLLSGVPFQLAPPTDPITAAAAADAQHPVDDPTLSPPGRPKRPRHRAGSPRSETRQPDPHPNPHPDGDEPVDRIDLYDYDQYSLTDEDRWWLRRLPASIAERADRPSDADSRSPTGKIRQHGPADVTLDGYAAPPLSADRCVCGGRLPPRQPHGARVQIRLSTLLGSDDHPALMPGLGPVMADLARQIALDARTRPAWRYSIVDEHGELLHHGHTTHRPTTMHARPAIMDQPAASCRFETGNMGPSRLETGNHNR